MPRFSNLSHELILQIAELLLEEEKDGSAEDSEYHHKAGAQATDLMSSGKEAIFNLSRTSTSFYRILSPYLFRCITLRNSEKSGQAVQYLCSTGQIANIKTLHFKCETSVHIESMFPTEVNDILSNLSQFPRLATLIIDLDLDDHYWDYVSLPWRMLSESEEIQKTEEQNCWRALINKTLKAISTTCSDGVREFVLKQCPTRTDSVFCSEQFNKWLGKLETFKFEVYGRRRDSGMRLTATSQFQSYIQNLDHYFFDAIGNVTRLAIIGHENGLIGQMFAKAFVPLKGTHVSKLKELELGYYIIQDDLLDFLVAHSSTLEHLIFNDSFLDCSRGSWKFWFHMYASEEPRALQCVTFIPYSGPIAPDYRSGDLELSIKTGQVPVEQKAEGKEHRTFPYGIIKNGFGELVREVGNITQRTREGDMDGWYELMAVVNRNRERVKGDGYSMVREM